MSSPDSPLLQRPMTVQRALPLSGVLAVIAGFGLLLAHWKFPALSFGWTQAHLLLFLLVSACLIYWGLTQVLVAFLPVPQRRSRRRLSRNRVLLPREGMLYLVIMAAAFVGSLIGHSNMLMLIFAMMAGPFILNGQITFAMLKKTRVTRRMPKRSTAGELVSAEIQIENRKRWLPSWLMTVRDQLTNEREQVDARVLFVRVPAGETQTAYYQMRLMQRGKYYFGPIELTTRFPLGLVERGLLFDEPAEIIVHPRVGPLSRDWKREHLLSDEPVQQRMTRSGAFDDEFHTMREFRCGDNPRAIHWRTSARKSELMVREFHQSRDRDLAVLLDLWLPRRPTADDLDRVELAVSFAASICAEHVRQSGEASLYVGASGNRLEHWECPASAANLELLLDTLAVLQAGASTGAGNLFDEMRQSRLFNPHVVFITTRKDAAGTVGNRQSAVGGGRESSAGTGPGPHLSSHSGLLTSDSPMPTGFGDVSVFESDASKLSHIFSMD